LEKPQHYREAILGEIHGTTPRASMLPAPEPGLRFNPQFGGDLMNETTNKTIPGLLWVTCLYYES